MPRRPSPISAFKKEGLRMIEIEKPRIEAADAAENGTYGKFVVEQCGI